RPGEKLYEELLIGDSVCATRHPMIMRATESSLPWVQVEALMWRLDDAYQRFDCSEMHAVLVESVAGFSGEGLDQDLFWQVAHPEVGQQRSKVAYLHRPRAQ